MKHIDSKCTSRLFPAAVRASQSRPAVACSRFGGVIAGNWYYLGLNGVLNAVELRPDGERLRLSPVQQLFQTGIVAPSKAIEQYAASPDGQSFLILKSVDNKVRSSIGVELNWPALLTSR